MVGLVELSGAIGGLKTALDIVKGLKSTADAVAINDAKIGLQGAIIDAQQGLMTAQEAQSAHLARIDKLEQDIVRLKNWAAEQKRYELSAIGGAAFAYILKDGMENGEPPHWLCQTCFQSGHKHILQFVKTVQTNGGRGTKSEWKCNSCSAVIHAGRSATPSDPLSWN